MRAVIPFIAAVGVLLAYQGMTGWRPVVHHGTGRLQILIDTAGVRWLTPARFILVILGIGATVLILVSGLTGSAPVGAAVALMAMTVFPSWLAATGRKRVARFREEWPDAIATLIAGIRGGSSLAEACVGVSLRCGEGLRPGFEAFTRTYRASGNLSASLEELRFVLADPVADRVAVALECAHSVGGSDLVRVLRALSDFVRSDLQVRREIEARWSWTTTAAKLAAAAPWVVLVVMSLRPEAAAAYGSSGGITLLVLGGVATVVGYLLMLRAARLPAETRLIR